MRTVQSSVLVLSVLVSMFAPSASALAAPTFAPKSPATPHLKAYQAWSALWWQWAIGTPADVSPVLDQTGANCAANQPVPGVFFLAGSFSSATLHRTCTVPVGTSFLIPVLAKAYFAQQSDPPEQRTEDFVRAQNHCVEQSPSLALSIDGTALANPLSYLELSNIFSISLPVNNIFGVPPQVLSPSADEGYYGFAEPLAPGPHTVHIASSSGCGVTQDVTYSLIVQGTVGTPISCSGSQQLNLQNVDIQSTGVALTVSGNCNVQVTNSVLWGETSGVVIHDQGHVIINGTVVGGGTSVSADGHGHGELRNSAVLGKVVTGPLAVVSDSGGNTSF